MDYNKIIKLLIVIVIVVLVLGTVFVMNPLKRDSRIDIITNGSIHTGSTFLVKLTDLDNNPIANESVSITILDNNSNTVINKSINTNDNGEAALEIINVSSGNYKVNITFNGNDNFKSSNKIHDLEIVDGAADVLSSDPVSSDVDSGAFYSSQAGRTIYTGEVHLAPDDHHWIHLGNNEWERID